MQVMAKTKEATGPARANALEERARLNLCSFIEYSGYSATQVADMSGIPQANLSRYMRGDSAIPLDALKPLADVLGRASTDDFFDREPARQRTAAELETTQPLFARARPGFEPTEEDLADFRDYLERVRARREKKKPKR